MRARGALSLALLLAAAGVTPAGGQSPPGYAECRVPLTDRVPFALASGDPMLDFAGDINGDFNGDGVPDIAVVDTQGDDVLVLFTNPVGLNANLWPAPPTPTVVNLETGGAIALAAGDLRDDGTWDLSVAESGGVSFLINNGTGVFAGNFPTGVGENATPRAIAMADFDQDGVVDVAVGTRIVRTGEPVSGSIRVLYTPRGGGAVTQVSVDETVPIDALAIGDIDDDGRLDIVALSADAAKVRIALNAASGQGFRTVFDADLGAGALQSPVALAVGNFDLDGGDDIAIVNGPGVPLILPTPTPKPPTATPVTPRTATVTATPIDTPTGAAPTETPTLTGTPTPTPTDTSSPTATPRTEFAPGNVVVFLSHTVDEGVAFEGTATLAAGAGPAGIAAGDYDQDGTPDLAITSIGDNRVIFYYGRRDGTFALEDPCANDGCRSEGGRLEGCCVRLGPRALIPVPFFNKLRPDLVVANAEDNSLSLLLSSMPLPTATSTVTQTGPPTATPSITLTRPPTRTRTPTEKPTPLPTATCPPTGICVQGEGCNIRPYADGGLSLLPVLALIALAIARRTVRGK